MGQFGQNTIGGYLETDSFVQNNQSYTLIECCFHAAIEKLRCFATLPKHHESVRLFDQIKKVDGHMVSQQIKNHS